MAETICIINSKICPYNDSGYCMATRKDMESIFDEGCCSNQGKRWNKMSFKKCNCTECEGYHEGYCIMDTFYQSFNPDNCNCMSNDIY